jgi:hypothetical protein
MRFLPLLLVAVAVLSAPPLRAEESDPIDDAAATLARLHDRISADLQSRIERAASQRVDRSFEAALHRTFMDCVQIRADVTECRVIAVGRGEL